MKILLILVLVLGLGGGIYVSQKNTTSDSTAIENKAETNTANTVATTPSASETATTVSAPSAVSLKTGTYALIQNESSIAWEASKPLISGYTHTGTIGLSKGEIVVKGSALSGNFTIDMNTIKVTSLGGGKAGKETALEGHLKGDNFFGTTSFPTGSFTIDSVTANSSSNSYTVKGNLTLKGVTKPVEFPVTITQSGDGKITAKGPVAINRTLWGITYASGNFYDNVANNAIDDTIKLQLTLVAK